MIYDDPDVARINERYNGPRPLGRNPETNGIIVPAVTEQMMGAHLLRTWYEVTRDDAQSLPYELFRCRTVWGTPVPTGLPSGASPPSMR